jgi:hypothetical protein
MVFGFHKKKEPEQIPPIELAPPKPETSESASMENIKAKIDLLATHIEGLRTQYSMINERLENLEKMVKEIYQLAKS